MTTINPIWTENVSLVAKQALNASGTDVDDLDIAASGYEDIVLQFTVQFDNSSTGDYKVEIYRSANSGITDDTIPTYTFIIPNTPGGHIIDSIKIPKEPYISVKRTNEDASYGLSETIVYAGNKWSSS